MKKIILLVLISFMGVISVNAANFDYTFTLEKTKIAVGEITSYEVVSKSKDACKGPVDIKTADMKVAEMVNSGIKGVSVGTTKVEVKWCGVTKEATLEVVEEVTKEFDYVIMLDSTSIPVGGQIGYSASPTSDLECTEPVKIKSSDERVAKIVDGKIKGVRSGVVVLNVEWCGVERNVSIIVTGGSSSIKMGIAAVLLVILVSTIGVMVKKNKASKG